MTGKSKGVRFEYVSTREWSVHLRLQEQFYGNHDRVAVHCLNAELRSSFEWSSTVTPLKSCGFPIRVGDVLDVSWLPVAVIVRMLHTHLGRVARVESWLERSIRTFDVPVDSVVRNEHGDACTVRYVTADRVKRVLSEVADDTTSPLTRAGVRKIGGRYRLLCSAATLDDVA